MLKIFDTKKSRIFVSLRNFQFQRDFGTPKIPKEFFSVLELFLLQSKSFLNRTEFLVHYESNNSQFQEIKACPEGQPYDT
jgi:hypothetical protein